MSITASEARQRLFPLIEEVNDDQVAVQIFSKKGTAFLIARPLRADQHGPAPATTGVSGRYGHVLLVSSCICRQLLGPSANNRSVPVMYQGSERPVAGNREFLVEYVILDAGFRR